MSGTRALGRRRRSTRPPASSPERSTKPARPQTPARRSTSSSALWPRARIRQQPPKIPTLPRSVVFPGSSA